MSLSAIIIIIITGISYNQVMQLIQCFWYAHMAHYWPKEHLIWHCTVLSLVLGPDEMAQLIMIILSLTALTLS